MNPNNSQAVLPPETPEDAEQPITYLDILQADDPKAAYEQYVTSDEQATELLGQAEDAVANAGCELELMRRTPQEKERFAEVMEHYDKILGLMLLRNVQAMQHAGDSEAKIKKVTIDAILDSKRSVFIKEIDKRLESSRPERALEWLARSKARRTLGPIAVAATSLLSAGLAVKGYDAGKEDIEHSFGYYAGAVAMGGLSSAFYAIRKGGAFLTATIAKSVLRRAPVSSTTKAEKRQAKQDSERVHFMTMHDEHAKLLKKELHTEAGDNHVGLERPEAFVTSLLGLSKESLMEFYQAHGSTGRASTRWLRRIFRGSVIEVGHTLGGIDEETIEEIVDTTLPKVSKVPVPAQAVKLA
ncbi:MAG TPA: hypothetical protein VG992_04890 [Candidatus Saccharimonadales bacterium]|nr:hypothetical protein [Candidatus Saccharimonadales bacterium]